MGKWSPFKNKLPPLPDPDPSHAKLVAAAKEMYSNKYDQLGPLLQTYTKMRDMKESKKLEMSALQIQIDAVEELIKERFDMQQISNMTIEGGATISTSPEPHGTVMDNAALVDWATKEGLTLSIPWQTMNSQLKRLLENGENAMPGVKAWIRTKVLYRRNK